MARCGCGTTCSCIVTAGSGVSVTGNGSSATPYVVSSEGGGGGGAYAPDVRGVVLQSSAVVGSGLGRDFFDIGSGWLLQYLTRGDYSLNANEEINLFLYGPASGDGSANIFLSVAYTADANGIPRPAASNGGGAPVATTRNQIILSEAAAASIGGFYQPNLSVLSNNGFFTQTQPYNVKVPVDGFYRVEAVVQWLA